MGKPACVDLHSPCSQAEGRPEERELEQDDISGGKRRDAQEGRESSPLRTFYQASTHPEAILSRLLYMVRPLKNGKIDPLKIGKTPEATCNLQNGKTPDDFKLSLKCSCTHVCQHNVVSGRIYQDMEIETT